MTFAEFEQLADAPGKHELIDGELIMSPQPKRRHSRIGRNCEDFLLRHFDRDWVWVELGFKIGEHYAQPDVSLIAGEQPEDAGYCAGAPMLAIEVLSSSNTAAEIERKVELYLTNKVQNAIEVWLLDGKRRTVTVYAVEAGTTVMARHTGRFRSRVVHAEVEPAVLFA
jgi:Uma2 family endonuclease